MQAEAGAAAPTIAVEPRPVAASVEELLDGAGARTRFTPADARSGATFDRVEIDGERCIVKYVHLDVDFAMRSGGDIGCLPLRVWASGLMDACPECIDHAALGVAGWGRNGWGAAILMRDVSAELVPATDSPLPEAVHEGFIDHLAALSARCWGWRDSYSLLPAGRRWQYFSPAALLGAEALGFPERVPVLALDGWQRFAAKVPGDVLELVAGVRDDTSTLAAALEATPSTFLHGDWKLGNLGRAPDGRTVLLDWTYPGEGPVCHELAWYLALNRSRLPEGHSKETTIEALRRSLELRGISTGGWWERQLGLCLLGALAQFGWEKALGDETELGWWCDRAREGGRWL
jgi:hypothetical protein